MFICVAFRFNWVVWEIRFLAKIKTQAKNILEYYFLLFVNYLHLYINISKRWLNIKVSQSLALWNLVVSSFRLFSNVYLWYLNCFYAFFVWRIYNHFRNIKQLEVYCRPRSQRIYIYINIHTYIHSTYIYGKENS